MGEFKVVKPAVPKHQCDLPNALEFHNRTIIECQICFRWWRNVQPGNPEYAKWKRAWVRRLLCRSRT